MFGLPASFISRYVTARQAVLPTYSVTLGRFGIKIDAVEKK